MRLTLNVTLLILCLTITIKFVKEEEALGAACWGTVVGLFVTSTLDSL